MTEIETSAWNKKRKIAFQRLRILTPNAKNKPEFGLIPFIDVSRKDWDLFLPLVKNAGARTMLSSPGTSSEEVANRNMLSAAVVVLFHHFPGSLNNDLKDSLKDASKRLGGTIQNFCNFCMIELIASYPFDIDAYQQKIGNYLTDEFGYPIISQRDKIDNVNLAFGGTKIHVDTRV
jgi:hypothetical protein